MLRLSGLLILLIAISSPAAAEEGGAGLASGLINPGYHEQPAWFKHSFLDLKEDVWEAAAEQRRVMLYFYQDGCPYCAKLLRENFALKEIADKTRAGFEVIAINIWGDNEVIGLDGRATTEKALAEQLKVMYTPTLLFLDERGEPVLRVNGYYPPHKFAAALDYVAAKQERKQSFREFLAQRQPPPASGRLHVQGDYLQPPLDLRPSSRPGGKPLLVLMEMKQCPPCDELHGQILNRPELRESLGRYDVALVDAWSAESLVTPAGKRMKSSDWAAELKVNYLPSMLFFDGEGREVFRAEAYLKAFHVRAALEYVASGEYLGQPNFQRFVQTWADRLRERGVPVDLME